MSLFEELNAELKEKAQGAVQKIQQLEQLYNFFKKLGASDSETEKNIVNKSLSDSKNLTNFSFTGQITDLSYFSQSDTMPISAIANIGDEKIKEAVKQTFATAAQRGLIELDGDNIKITKKGEEYINQPDFAAAARKEQVNAYNAAVEKMAAARTGETQMCVALSGDYMRDFTVFNYTDSIDLSTVINNPDRELSKKILSNVKKWEKCGAVTVENGIAKITDMGKKMIDMPQFKAAVTPAAEKALSAVGGAPGKAIVLTKKILGATVKAVQTTQSIANSQKR